MSVPYRSYSTRKTHQSEPVPGKDMTENNAGGFVFAVDGWEQLDRFLILGSNSPTYYVSEKELTKENGDAVLRCIKQDGIKTVNRILEISNADRAPKNDPALFALAMCASFGNDETKKHAMTVLPKIARIGTHLFHFVTYVEQFRGWGRILSNGIKAWYQEKDVDNLAYQMVKYQSRDGWSHRDLLRLSHPKAKGERNNLYRWSVGKEQKTKSSKLPEIVTAFEKAKVAEKPKDIVTLISKHNLPRECVPTQFLTNASVWEALLEKMPTTAMIRNLATMTRVGLIAPMSDSVKTITDKLSDREQLKKARIHPLSVLSALKTYEQGHGERGQSTWKPVSQIVDALDDAFYASFDFVEPTGKRFYLGCDVSDSMWGSYVANVIGMSPGMITGALAMVTARTEKQYAAGSFNTHMYPFTLSPKMRLDAVCRKMESLPWGGTDCAQPMLYCTMHKIPVDVFIIYTDNETWAGVVHPFQALKQYRQKMGINAKLITVGMVSNGFTIADPSDAGMLDIVGMDTAVPQLIADFVQK